MEGPGILGRLRGPKLLFIQHLNSNKSLKFFSFLQESVEAPAAGDAGWGQARGRSSSRPPTKLLPSHLSPLS